MPSAYEAREIVEFVGASIDEFERTVQLPEEVSGLLTAIDEQLSKLASGGSDFEYWDKVHDAIESYRTATDATFTGNFVPWKASKLGAKTGVFGRILKRMDQGVARALSYALDKDKLIS